MNTNTVIIIGHLTRDPEDKSTGEYKVCNFSVAVNGFKDNDVSYFKVSAFNKIATNVYKYCRKGSQVCITGSLKQIKYKNKEGKDVFEVVINANRVEFIGPKSENKKYEKKNQDQYDFNSDDFAN